AVEELDRRLAQPALLVLLQVAVLQHADRVLGELAVQLPILGVGTRGRRNPRPPGSPVRLLQPALAHLDQGSLPIGAVSRPAPPPVACAARPQPLGPLGGKGPTYWGPTSASSELWKSFTDTFRPLVAAPIGAAGPPRHRDGKPPFYRPAARPVRRRAGGSF